MYSEDAVEREPAEGGCGGMTVMEGESAIEVADELEVLENEDERGGKIKPKDERR